jgi:hypothetical protein
VYIEYHSHYAPWILSPERSGGASCLRLKKLDHVHTWQNCLSRRKDRPTVTEIAQNTYRVSVTRPKYTCTCTLFWESSPRWEPPCIFELDLNTEAVAPHGWNCKRETDGGIPPTSENAKSERETDRKQDEKKAGVHDTSHSDAGTSGKPQSDNCLPIRNRCHCNCWQFRICDNLTQNSAISTKFFIPCQKSRGTAVNRTPRAGYVILNFLSSSLVVCRTRRPSSWQECRVWETMRD